MVPQRPHRIDEIVQTQSSLAALLATARHLERLRRVLGERLGSPIAEHFAVARVDAEALVLVTDSAAWGSRLRYLEREILDQTRQVLEGDGAEVPRGGRARATARGARRAGGRRLQILVRPPERAGVGRLEGTGPQHGGGWQPQPSPSGATVLEQVAGSLADSNPALAAVMRRAATRLRK
ncbi:MAG: DUF721 domain-containing protein [Chromatiales bacterium]|nr:DUF721 domain-containing protein [Chromatiales bacterium]